MRLSTLGDHPRKRDKVDALLKLMKSLETQAGAPMTEIRETFAQMKALGPSLHEELKIIDNNKINDDVEKLNAAVTHLRQLADNAEEGFRAGKVADELLAEIEAFEEAGSASNTAVYGKESELEDKLHEATSGLDRGREKAGPAKNDPGALEAERDELYRLSEEVDRAVLDPILHPPS